MKKPSVDSAVFAIMPLSQRDARRSVMDVVTAPDFSLAPITIAVGDATPVTYAANAIDAAVAALRGAADAGKTFVGFGINTLIAALNVNHGISFEHTVDTQHIMRFLALADGYENARAFAGEGAGADIEVVRVLFRKMFDEERFPFMATWVADRGAQENLRGIAVDRTAARQLLAKMGTEQLGTLSDICESFPDFDTNHLHNAGEIALFCASLPDDAAARLRGLVHRYLGLESTARDVDKIACGHDRLFFPLRFHGTRTGRFSASGGDSGRVNIHGFPARDDAGRSALLREVRSLLVADKDESWISCDLSSIDPRVAALLAGETRLLQLFASGQDVYIAFASMVFPGVEIVKNGVNGHLRALGKEAVISLIYGMSLPSFTESVLAKFPDVDPVLIERVYSGFDQEFPMIRLFRERLFREFRETFADGKPRRVGLCQINVVDDVADGGPHVAVQLPTWRSLYFRSVVRLNPGPRKIVYKFAPAMNLKDHRQNREEIHESRLVNNVCQAVAWDVVAHHQYEVERNSGLRARFNVHDELVFASRRCSCPRRDDLSLPLDARHEVDCAWIDGRKAVKNAMSRVFPALHKLSELPVACELSDSIRDRWGQ